MLNMFFFSISILHQKHFEQKIKAIQSNWGGEYRILHNYFAQNGISHSLLCSYTHQQIRSIEC